MRSLSAGALATLASSSGIEPVLIVEIAWGDSTIISYSDRVFQEYNLMGKLLELNTFDSFVNVETGSNSATATIKLDDTDGSIKAIFNNVDIQKRPVNIYQWFANLPISDAFLVFEGLINSPMVWDEGARTLSIEAITHLEDLEAGFSVEDGQFTNVPVDMVGKPWPMPFGTVINMPALRIDDIPTGQTEQNYGISDPTLATEIQKIICQSGKQVAMGDCLSRAGADLILAGWFDEGGSQQQDFQLIIKGEELQQRARDIFNAVAGNSAKQVAQLQAKQSAQQYYDTNVLQIANGWKFTQGVEVGVKIGKDSYYFGVFNGDSFTVFSRMTELDILMMEPTQGPWVPQLQQQLNPPSSSSSTINIQFPSVIGGPFDPYLSFAGYDPTDNLDFLTPTKSEKDSNPCGPPNFLFFESAICAKLLGGSQQSQFATRQALYHIPAGSSVKPAFGYPIRYVVSIIPGTTVIGVSAMGTLVSDVNGVYVSNGIKTLVSVPQPYWSVSEQNFGGITATILTVIQPLDSIVGYDFGNQPYVSVVSPVGPNMMDILAYFINTWASPIYSIDPVSFATVHAQVAAFPCNFYLAEKKNVFQIIKDLSYQSRIMTSFGEGTFEFLYLPQDATPVDSISESDVLSKSLTVTTTRTEDIVTQYKATWQDDYSNPVKNIWVLQYNLAKYGLHKAEHNIQIYNLEWEVEKTALFWLLRSANTYKILKCKLLIHKLNLEPLDTISLAFTNNYVANGTVPGIILKADFNPTDYTIDCEIWVPVLLGTMSQYFAANPANYAQDVLGINTEEAGTPAPILAHGDIGGRTVNITTTAGTAPKVSASDQGFAADAPPVMGSTTGAVSIHPRLLTAVLSSSQW